jgi:hypothetical protein
VRKQKKKEENGWTLFWCGSNARKIGQRINEREFLNSSDTI